MKLYVPLANLWQEEKGPDWSTRDKDPSLVRFNQIQKQCLVNKGNSHFHDWIPKLEVPTFDLKQRPQSPFSPVFWFLAYLFLK